MSLVRRVTRAAAAMKPPHGQPCNRCGVCCEVSLCPLGAHVFQMPETLGPCPALMGEPGVSTSCGLVVEPEWWAPLLVALYGKDVMSQAASVIVSAGDGCDARINGEPINHAFNAKLEKRDQEMACAIDVSKALWRMPS